MKQYRLKDVWDDVIADGLFGNMEDQDLIPHIISDSPLTAAEVDMLYHINHSGEKPISPVVDYMAQSNAEVIESPILVRRQRETLAKLIYDKFAAKWDRLFDTLNEPYNPLENYNMDESSIETITGTEDTQNVQSQNQSSKDKTVGSTSKELNDTNIEQTQGTQETSYDSSTETAYDSSTTTQDVTESDSNNSIFAFNSEVAAPQNESASVATNTQTTTKDGADTTSKDGTDTVTTDTNKTDNRKSKEDTSAFTKNETELEGNATQKGSKEHEQSRNLKHNRHGNIGVTTSQQMLESELELRRYDLLSVIFEDCDSVLCLNIY